MTFKKLSITTAMIGCAMTVMVGTTACSDDSRSDVPKVDASAWESNDDAVDFIKSAGYDCKEKNTSEPIDGCMGDTASFLYGATDSGKSYLFDELSSGLARDTAIIYGDDWAIACVNAEDDMDQDYYDSACNDLMGRLEGAEITYRSAES